jgi:hypothetical protein
MIRQEDIELFIRSHHLDHTEWCDVLVRYELLSFDFLREMQKYVNWDVCRKVRRKRKDKKFLKEFWSYMGR